MEKFKKTAGTVIAHLVVYLGICPPIMMLVGYFLFDWALNVDSYYRTFAMGIGMLVGNALIQSVIRLTGRKQKGE